MSSFTGKIKEYPQISVDRFDGRNLASTAYFLSHAHSDHMIGLSSPQFLDHLESNSGVYLYCSPITCRFLQASIRHSPLSPYLRPLQLEEPMKITIPNVAEEVSHHLWVTLIPAAHCPGSVMFLYEGRGGTVLYTGDFRISAGEAARLRPLHNEDGSVKMIDSLHIDTTFCHKDIMHFPSREESAQAIGELVEDWLVRGNNYLIHLICPAKYGYEYLYRSLHDQFGMKIHVSNWKYRMYDNVPEIQDLLTRNATVTWIHSCDFRTKNDGETIERCTNRQLPCRCVPFGAVAEPNIRVIKPSAMFYTMYQSAKEIKQINDDGSFCRVLLSMHASCSEVLDLVSYLRPRKVFPNVIPLNSTKEEVLKLLHEALNCSGDHYSIEYGGSQRPSLGSYKRQIQDIVSNGGSASSSSMMDAGLLGVYLPSASKRRRHSDSNMALILPTPRGNIKGSVSLEGESSQLETITDSCPSTSTEKCSMKSTKDLCEHNSDLSDLEWKDPYSPSPTKSTMCNSQELNVPPSRLTNNRNCRKKILGSSDITEKEKDGLARNRFSDGVDDPFPEGEVKSVMSQESIELNSVFSDSDKKEGSVIASNSCSIHASIDSQCESPIKRSRKMWYKHKYFSTPVHDEVDRGLALESKPSMGLRSSSLPLPELPRENLMSPDLFSSTDGECDCSLPLITVSSPSDQASESQVSDETIISTTMSTKELFTVDLSEDIPRDFVTDTLMSADDDTIDADCHSSLRPSVIRSPHKADTASNVEVIKLDGKGSDGHKVPKAKGKKWFGQGSWIDCTKTKPSTPKNIYDNLTFITVRNLPNSRRVPDSGEPCLVQSGQTINKECPEIIDLISDSECSEEITEIELTKEMVESLPSSSRTSCLKTTRRTHNQVEVVSLEQQNL